MWIAGIVRSSGVCLVAIALLMPGIAAAMRADTAVVYVTVLDRDRPVTGLTARDFTVKEDATLKTVVSAAAATRPLSVVLLTDRFGLETPYTPVDVRNALSAFARTLLAGSPESEIGLITFDGAAVPVVRPTSSRASLERAFNTLTPSRQAPVLLDAVFAGSLASDSLPTDRRVLLAIYAGYSRDLSNKRAPPVVAEMRRAGVALWTIEARSVFQQNPVNIDRDAVTDLAGKASGGLHESVGQGTALEARARRMAELLLAQYAVEYAAPKRGAQGLEVGVSVRGAKVIAPTWPR